MPFDGFEHLDSNFVWTPNQFLDHCVVTHDRGVVRLVGYVLFQTLRLLDENGLPVQQDISVSFNQLVREAGVSRGAATKSLGLAQKDNFVACTQNPSAKSSGQSGQSGKYRIKWCELFTGADCPFEGFYSGDGRRTQIPHAFFTKVLPFESLSVIRVVAAVMRHTIGYSNQFGGRRSNAPLSFSRLEVYTGLSRSTLSLAVASAIESGFISIVESGVFDPHLIEQKANMYCINWASVSRRGNNGSEIGTEESQSSVSVQKSAQDRFKKRYSNGSKISTGSVQKSVLYKESNKEVSKQHNKQRDVDSTESSATADNARGFKLLLEQGVSENTARSVAKKVTLQNIIQQIEWLPDRKVRQNSAGYLVTACLKNFGAPIGNDEMAAKQSAMKARKRDQLIETWKTQPNTRREHWRKLALQRNNDPRVR